MDLIAYILAKKAAAQGIAEEQARAEAAEQELQDAIEREILRAEDVEAALQAAIDKIEARSDVVDVVGTKAELDSYDVSTLSDNDIIKVLVDETHDDAISYYRYVVAESGFVYVGSVDGYYTKAQSEDIFNHKITNAMSYEEIDDIATTTLHSVAFEEVTGD